MHRIFGYTLFLTMLTAVGTSAQDQGIDPLALKARAVLQTYCYRCHGENGSVEGGVNYLLDRQQLVARNKVLPKEGGRSKLFRRVFLGEMPPEEEKLRPSEEEVLTLKKWIDAGAPDFNLSTGQRTFLSEPAVWQMIHEDLDKRPPWERRFTRYFTITHLYNAGLAEDELTTYRQGISKLLNSLSWGPTIVVPTPVDPAGTILRIDLRHYRWSERSWQLLTEAYPFGLWRATELEKECQKAANTPLPMLRGDWFVARAALPPLYHDLLQLPASDRDLERRLRVDVAENLRDGLALRAGFNGSGVSRNNRLIERHETSFGAYWKSYDFAGNTGSQNLFASPLGPGPGSNTFQHDGGELIFNLPNGLQAYMLVDARGQRIDKGPTAIVSDPRRPDRAVVNGLSCMSCHVRGTIPKEDQVRPHVDKNQQAFSREELATIEDLYAPREQLLKAFEEDAERFRRAVEQTGGRLGTMEPILALALRFESEMDHALAAAELGLTAADLQKSFAKSVTLGRLLGPLAVEGGTVQRQVFTDAFAALVRDLELGTTLAGPRPTSTSPGWPGPATVQPLDRARPNHFPTFERGDHQVCRFDSRFGAAPPIRAVAFHPKQPNLLASESQTGVVTLWDARASSAVRVHFVGHQRNILGLDFSPDGKFLVTGGMDQTARVWEVATGREFFNLQGHAGFVYAVKFSPDGTTRATASERIRLWSLTNGQEIAASVKLPDWVRGLAFSPDGRTFASACRAAVHLWDAQTAEPLAELKDSQGSALAVAFSPYGKVLASAGGDHTVVLWDLTTRQVKQVLKGHHGPLSALAFSPQGNLLLSAAAGADVGEAAGEAKVWDPDTGKELISLTGHTKGVAGVVIKADGKQAATAGLDGTVRLWDLKALGRTTLAAFEGHAQPISSLALGPEGHLALTGSLEP